MTLCTTDLYVLFDGSVSPFKILRVLRDVEAHSIL